MSRNPGSAFLRGFKETTFIDQIIFEILWPFWHILQQIAVYFLVVFILICVFRFQPIHATAFLSVAGFSVLTIVSCDEDVEVTDEDEVEDDAAGITHSSDGE